MVQNDKLQSIETVPLTAGTEMALDSILKMKNLMPDSHGKWFCSSKEK